MTASMSYCNRKFLPQFLTYEGKMVVILEWPPLIAQNKNGRFIGWVFIDSFTEFPEILQTRCPGILQTGCPEMLTRRSIWQRGYFRTLLVAQKGKTWLYYRKGAMYVYAQSNGKVIANTVYATTVIVLYVVRYSPEGFSPTATSQGYFPNCAISPTANSQVCTRSSARCHSQFQPKLLAPHCSLWCLRGPNLTSGKLRLGKLHIWEVATWEIFT